MLSISTSSSENSFERMINQATEAAVNENREIFEKGATDLKEAVREHDATIKASIPEETNESTNKSFASHFPNCCIIY